MTDPLRPPPSAQDAARSDCPSTPPPERPLPEFEPARPSPYSPIEREIERSERALAALAASRALARASFTDSELAADDAAGLHDFETGSWTRTEYAPLDHGVREDDDERAAAPRHLLGGTFDPGVAAPEGLRFPGTSIAHTPMRTRSGAHARFAQESRQAPRGDGPAVAGRSGATTASGGGYDKPEVMPMLAPLEAMPPAAPRAPARADARGPARWWMGAGLGAVVLLAGAGVAWKAGLLSRSNPDNPAMVTPAVVAQAEAARVLSAQQDLPLAPAAGVPSRRTNEEVDAALAAAARAAAVPADSVRAAGPTLLLRAAPLHAAASAPSARRHAAPAGRDAAAPADAVVDAQARASAFSDPAGAATAEAPTDAASAP